MDGEGEHVHGGEHRGKVFLAVAKMALGVITVIFQDVKSIVRDLPSRSGTSGDFGDVLRVDIKRGREVAAAGLLLPFWIENGQIRPIDGECSLAIPRAEAPLNEPAKAVFAPLATDFPQTETFRPM